MHGTCHHDCPDSCGWEVTVEDGVAVKMRGRRRPPVQPRRAVPEGQPLPRPRLQPRPRAPPAAPGRRRRARAASSRSRGTTPSPRSPTRLHDVIDRHGAEAILPFSDAGNQSLLSMIGPRRPLLPPPRRQPARAGDLRPDRRPRRAHDQRQRPRPRPARAAPQPADPAVGHQHPPHQPPPLADHRGGPRRRRQGRRHRPDPHDHRRGRRRVRPAAARAPTSR